MVEIVVFYGLFEQELLIVLSVWYDEWLAIGV